MQPTQPHWQAQQHGRLLNAPACWSMGLALCLLALIAPAAHALRIEANKAVFYHREKPKITEIKALGQGGTPYSVILAHAGIHVLAWTHTNHDGFLPAQE